MSSHHIEPGGFVVDGTVGLEERDEPVEFLAACKFCVRLELVGFIRVMEVDSKSALIERRGDRR